MTENEQKQQFSFAYLHAVAARAGFSFDRPSTDYESIDAILGTAGEIHGQMVFRTSPKLEIQLKATADDDCLKTDHVSFELELKNYNDLRRPALVPRLLVVLLLPKDQSLWLTQDEEKLIARRCAYWMSLQSLPDTDNQSSVTVHLPRENLLTAESLQGLMLRVEQGERP